MPITGGASIRILFVCAIAATAAAFVRPVFAADQKVALVIGNSAYPTSRLRNSVNDATAMAAKLRALGFDVILRTDVNQRDMTRSFSQFGQKLVTGSVGLFYYAGHGVQVQGKNFLIPVDAEIDSEASVRTESVDVDLLLYQLGRARLSMVILDACRNNPFEHRFRGAGGGLAQIDAPTGTLIAYATAPGKVAADGTGVNGLYTSELLKSIDTPGQRIEDVFKQVRINVLRASDNQQIPWESSSLTGEFYFRPGTRAEFENVKLQQSESERAALVKEMNKLRAELLALRTEPAATTATAVGATSTTAAPKPAAAITQPAQVALAAPAPAPSVASAPASEWANRIALLEKSRGKLTLSKALAILLDMTADSELGLLLLHEEAIKRKNWNNGYAMGADDRGNLVWGGAFQLQSPAWAAESALEQCASGPGKSCRAVIVNGDFRETEFLTMAKNLGAQGVAATREAFVKSLAERPPEVRIGLSGVAGGGTGDFHYAFGYSSVRK